MKKVVLSANTDWYLYNFRLSLSRAIVERGYDLVLLSPPGPYADALRSEGFCWKSIRLNRKGINPVEDFFTVLVFLSAYRRERPQLVHHFTIKPVVYGSIAARLTRVPAVVNSVTGLGYLFVNPGSRASILRWIARHLYRLALTDGRAWAIFQNESDAQLFESAQLVRTDRFSVIRGSGVDIDRFVPVPEPPGELVALYAGRMLWDKGIGELVEAARILRSERVGLRVVLAGATDPGNPATIAEDQLMRWQEQGLIEWWGHRDDMAAVLSQCHIFVLPSYGEGVSRSLLEAAAAGRPVVATDIPGSREVVKHGRNGLLVPARDAVALAGAMRKMAEDRDLRARMGQEGRQVVEKEFSSQRVDADTLTLYERRLGEASRQARM